MMSFFKIDSVTDTTDLWTFVGIQNYEKLFATAIFRKSMLNLFKIWAIGGAIVLSVSLLFGVILTSGIRGQEILSCGNLSSEPCKCGSSCNYVVTVLLYIVLSSDY